MPTPKETRDLVDAKLAQIWPQIQAKQDAYFAAHGRYWQGLPTRKIAPEDGTEEPATVGTTTPTDQPDPWPTVIRNAPLPMTIQVDSYDGPEGPGYSATVYVRASGTTYTRTANHGPETWRVEPWHQVEEGTP